jgi:hypothetical protein
MRSNTDNWYEVRADGEKVAAFAPISRDASTAAFKLVEVTRQDLYREKVLQIVECREVYANGCFLGTQVDIIHEEHPTVLDLDFPFAPAGSINL